MTDGTNLWKTQFSSDLSDWTDAVEDTHVKTTIGESGLPGDVLQTVTVTVTIIAGTSQSPLDWREAIPEE